MELDGDHRSDTIALMNGRSMKGSKFDSRAWRYWIDGLASSPLK